ncbi:UDP-glycosyltransferase 85C1-like [Bidens hawaiensis]|uniref:UDP-glycosyltransferase 85C1-like n=1 Tax=Bidens hawaiensis TaxID=980011 RepID=UPI00404A4357
MDQKKPHVLFIPSPAQSHIKCMLKLARLLNHKGLSVTFINTQTNQKRLIKSGGTRWLDDTPNFQFKTVPDGLPSATEDDAVEHTQTVVELWSYMGTNFYDSFLDVVSGLETPVTCIVCDGFMTYTNTILAAEKLKIPIILFWTMAACGFMGFYQVKVIMEKGLVPVKDESALTDEYLNMEIDWIPGMEGLRLKELPEFMRYSKLDDHLAFKFLLETAQAAHNVSHIIIHTFEELEDRLVKGIKSIFPNVCTVGRLQLHLNQIAEKEAKNMNLNGYSLLKEEPECVQWLQSKEPNSVVYVNFGSMAVMSLQDLVEFGWGLVNSNVYFLWIIRTDLVDGEPAVLPQELKDAMKEKGFVASWCSQEEVLNHPAVGGFLTHGGWGSIIESLSSGVPMICWPVSGDQQINCRQMCKEWEVGMEIEKNVKRDEAEKLVRVLMEGLEGEKMRKKAMELKKH